jgi:hypothetical protein
MDGNPFSVVVSGTGSSLAEEFKHAERIDFFFLKDEKLRGYKKYKDLSV